ncbi:MAG: hypothetical protein FWF76_05700 [Oscillospiraceae bacterium]|nr:hypothetical protein [Oscillospiraceae bacterium]
MSDLKWLACQGVDLNPYNLSVCDRLNKYGYALIFDEFGNGKVDKAELCIHRVLSENQKPNILIVCPQSLMQKWYSSLLSGIGADFKFISGTDSTVAFFSSATSNLMIVSEESLRVKATVPATTEELDVSSEYGEAGGIDSQRRVKTPPPSGIVTDANIVWDLMIIDAALATDGADFAGYDACKNKAHQLLVFAPCPFSNDYGVIASLPLLKAFLKAFLYDESKKSMISELVIDEKIVAFSKETPVTRYYTVGKLNTTHPNVLICEYEVDSDMFSDKNRIVDIQSGVPYYTYGGNLFEEFEAPQKLKNLYWHVRYNQKDVETLRKADAKLDAFLTKLDTVLVNEGNNAVIYFTAGETLEYISKVLNAVYPELKDKNAILTRTDSVLDSRFLKLRFSGENEDVGRITLATDSIGEHYHGMGKVTHVFNYEYPENPAELERRFFRTARAGCGNLLIPEEFIMFADKEMQFDGRILAKVMFGQLHKCIKTKIPTQNVLFWVPEAEKYISKTLLDLKSGGGGVKKFGVEYNIADRGLVSTVAKSAAYAEQLLEKLSRLLEVETLLFENGKNENLSAKQVDILHEKIRESLNRIKSGYVYYEEASDVPKIVENSNNLEKLTGEYSSHEIVKGVQMAKAELERLISKTKSGEYPPVREVLSKLPEALKTPTLYNIWKYCKLHKDNKRELREFMNDYNNGVI